MQPSQAGEGTAKIYGQEWYSVGLGTNATYRYRHVHVTFRAQRCCNDEYGGSVNGRMQVCLTRSTGETEIVSSDIGRCEQVHVLAPAATVCGRRDADYCHFEDVSTVIELAGSEDAGAALLIVGTPVSSNGLQIQALMAADCDATGACCPAEDSYDANGDFVGLSIGGDDDSSTVPVWALLLVCIAAAAGMAVMGHQVYVLRTISYEKIARPDGTVPLFLAGTSTPHMSHFSPTSTSTDQKDITVKVRSAV